jgi:signal transduction histidine kinase
LLVLGQDRRGLPAFQFSFEPEAVAAGWQVLRSRLLSANSPRFREIDTQVGCFPAIAPDYRLVMQFSRELLKHLADVPIIETQQPRCRSVPMASPRALAAGNGKHHPAVQRLSIKLSPEVELLQALTHEIRTPLTTIRTMARLLLKNPNLTPAMAQQLQTIDRECTEQIDRMELIFRAIELETTTSQERSVQLVPMSLAQVLQASVPRWKKQAERRNVELDVVLPQQLPQVVSDPAMFDRVLAGLMEKFTGSLPMGGTIRLEVTTAGNQIKLQFHTQSACPTNPFKSLGNLLVFQPETGSLSLNLNVTKNLFQALGGKLIVRQRSQQEEIFTIFFPLGNAPSYCSH